jgi:hypothetical protein
MEINLRLKDNKENITEVVDPKIISQDEDFTNYITNSNNSFSKKQITSLKAIKYAVEDKTFDLKEQQLYLKKKCLEYWGLPDIDNDFNSKKRNFNNYKGFLYIIYV